MPAAGFAYAFLQLSRSAITLYLPSSPVIAYSERFTIAHLPTKKRSLSLKEKAIAFVQSLQLSCLHFFNRYPLLVDFRL
jgi:hypothetical protein